MSGFSDKGLLGELEQLVLLAAIRLGDDAYAVSIRDEMHTRARTAGCVRGSGRRIEMNRTPGLPQAR
jgi:hypothetical protein